MTKTEEKNYNPKAIAWTVGVHALLLLMFFLVSYTLPADEPIQPELGMEVNLGTDADGSGDDQPMDINDPANDAKSAAYKTAAQQSSTAGDMMTTDETDAPVVNNPNTVKNNNRNNTRVTTPVKTTQNATDNNTNRTQRPRYVYSGATGTGGNRATENHAGTSEGNTVGNGDRGVPGGTPGADNYVGSPGAGTGGIGHTLGNRGISPRSFVAEFNKSGTVTANVKVDRNGNITIVSIKGPDELVKIAREKIRMCKFAKNPDAAPEVFTTLTIPFKLR